MRKIFFFLSSLIFTFFFLSTPIHAAESITSFNSDITINQDTSLTIKETISYQTTIAKHGIYRYIPIHYKQGDIITSNPIRDVSITDQNQKPIPYSRSYQNNSLYLKIGDPNSTFTGSKTYVITYTIARALTHLSGHDQLLWDITGEGWNFPIEKSQTTITSPYADITDSTCYTGRFGSTTSDCQISQNNNTLTITADNPISYNQNFTINLSLSQPNQLHFPNSTFNLLTDNFLLLLLPLPLIIFFLLWFYKGRDYQFISPNVFNTDPKKPHSLRPLFAHLRTPMVYEPLKLTPGQTGAIIDEKVDNQDVVSEIIDLARQKYLSIKQIKKTGFLKFGNDYQLTRLKKSPTSLPKHQAYLLDHLFETKDKVTISSLKGTFYKHIQKTKDLITASLLDKKLYTRNPVTSRILGLIFALFINFALFIAFAVLYFSLNIFWPLLIIFPQFILSLIFAWNLPQKTAVGTNYMLQARGLRQTIARGAWRERIKEKHLFIEEILPFAVSLGVINRLARDMKDLNLKPPQYANSGFTDAILWSSFISDFNSSTSQTLTYNPSSSSSGGGGFSGGGGGGGGGGSW